MADKKKMTIQHFTIGELMDMEDVGAQFTGDSFELSLRTLAAFAWVLKRRDDPGFTYEMARAMGVEEVGQYVVERVEIDPPAAAEEASGNATSLSSAPSASSTASRRRRSGA